ncbi:MAG: PQQ-dependent sugar dehydrogenase [Longimicrobiales bacterium]
MNLNRIILAGLLAASPALGQTTGDPFTPIRASEGVIRVDYRDFARVPDVDSQAARMMLMIDEPGAPNFFVNDMRGALYRISADGRIVAEYVNIDDPVWGHDVQSQGRERGFQSFAFHPQFSQRGAPGFGKFYTWSDVTDKTPAPDFVPSGDGDSHDMELLEWTARTPGAAKYDGEKPRELLRVQHPFGNHNGGQLAFNPQARPGTPEFGKLYIGNADGGSAGDPMNMAQNLASVFGKILRIDPLGSNSKNGKYGIPSDNPFVGTANALGEIWALGVRNPQRFGWDPANGNLYVADIGQNIVEEVSPVRKGGNLGWNVWEGSFRYLGRAGIDTTRARGDAAMIYPIAEFDHTDPILTGRSAATGLIVYRGSAIRQLGSLILFGDNPSGEVFAVSAANPPAGGQHPIRRILLNDGGEATTLLELIRKTNTAQGKQPAARADLRFGSGRDGQVFLLNKQDGVVRLLVASAR